MKVQKITGYYKIANLNPKTNIKFSHKPTNENDTFVRNILKTDKNGTNVFQLGSLDEIKKAAKKLDRKQIVDGIFATNITGANAMHLAQNSPKRIRTLCSYLKSNEIAALAVSKDGYRRVPFFDFYGESFRTLLENVSAQDVKDLILYSQDEDNINCLYTFQPDKIQTLFDSMDKKDIKELCMQQDKYYQNTPFHVQSNEAFEILCSTLSPEDLADIFAIENMYGISINKILEENPEKMQIYKKHLSQS